MPSACPVAPDGSKRTVPTGADDRGAVTMYTSDDNAETFKQVSRPPAPFPPFSLPPDMPPVVLSVGLLVTLPCVAVACHQQEWQYCTFCFWQSRMKLLSIRASHICSMCHPQCGSSPVCGLLICLQMCASDLLPLSGKLGHTGCSFMTPQQVAL